MAAQLFACYAKVKRIRALAAIVGEEELTALDKDYLKFGKVFEDGVPEPGSMRRTGPSRRRLISAGGCSPYLPADELYRISREDIQKYYIPSAGAK